MRQLMCAVALLLSSALGQSPVVVTLNLNRPGPIIPDQFIGLSYETKHLLPGSNGGHYFSASNTALIKTFQMLGVKSLHVGGNTADTGPIPSATDADDLFAFAKAAGVDVIYTLKLKNSSANANAAIAGHIVKGLAVVPISQEECESAIKKYEQYVDDLAKTFESLAAAYTADVATRERVVRELWKYLAVSSTPVRWAEPNADKVPEVS